MTLPDTGNGPVITGPQIKDNMNNVCGFGRVVQMGMCWFIGQLGKIQAGRNLFQIIRFSQSEFKSPRIMDSILQFKDIIPAK